MVTDERDEFVDVCRLEKRAEEPLRLGLPAHWFVAGQRDHGNLPQSGDVLKLTAKRQSVHDWHHEVQQDDAGVETFGSYQTERIDGIGSRRDPEALDLKEKSQSLP